MNLTPKQRGGRYAKVNLCADCRAEREAEQLADIAAERAAELHQAFPDRDVYDNSDDDFADLLEAARAAMRREAEVAR